MKKKNTKSKAETLHQKAKETIQLNEEIYHQLMDNSGIGVGVYSLDGKIIMFNKKALEHLNGKSEDYIGKSLKEVFGEQAGSIYIRRIQTAAKSDKSIDFEDFIQLPSGGCWFLSNHSRIKNLDGEVIGIQVIAHDITKHKQAENLIKESEERFRSLFENMTEGVALHEMLYDEKGNPVDYRILNVNRTFERHTGISSKKAIGSLASILYGMASPPYISEYSMVAQYGNSFSFETYFQPMERYFNISVFSPKKDQFVTVFYDITERKRADQESQRLNRALRTVSGCNQALIHATGEVDFMNNVCRIVTEIGGYRLAWIGYAEQDETKSVRPIAQAGYEKGYLETLHIRWDDTERGRGPTGTAIRTGQTCINRNILTNPNFSPWRAEAIKRGYAASIVLPLKIDEQVLGSLNIYSADSDVFNTEETKLLTELADDLSYGIVTFRSRLQQAQAEEKLQQSATHIQHLNEVLCSIQKMQQIILHERNPHNMLQEACQILVQTRGYVMVWVGQTEEGSKRVINVAQAGIEENPSKLAPITWDDSPSGQGPCGTAIRERRTVVINDIRNDHSFALWIKSVEKYGALSIASVPLLAGQQLFGAITVKAERPNAFDEEEIELLGNAAKNLAQALQSISDEAALFKSKIELAESESLLRSIAETSKDVIFVKDRDYRFVFMNPEGYRFNGKTPEQLLGRSKADFNPHPEEVAKFNADDQRVMDSGQIETIEEELYAADGTQHFYLTTKVPWRDSQNNIIGLTGMAHDITERKLSERALQKSEASLQSILSSTADGILAVDNQGKVIQTNDRFTNLWHIPKTILESSDNEVLLKFVLDQLVNPEEFLQEVKRLYSTDELTNDTLTFKDGRFFERRSAPLIVKGEMKGRVWSFSDVTSRRQAEEQLKLLKHSIDIHYDGAYWMDTDNKFFYVNDTGCKALGYTKEELIGKTVKEVNPQATDEVMKHVWDCLRKNGFYSHESLHHRKDGSKFPVEVVSTYVNFGGSEYNCGFARDITDRKQAEKALIENQRLSAIGEMTSSIAHDFNNSLQSIYGSVELTLLNPNLPEDTIEYLKTIRTSASDAAKRIQQIQRFGGKKHQLNQYFPVDINTLITDVINQTRPLWKDDAEKKGILFSFKMRYNKVPKILGNDGELRTAFYNIIKNSIESMPDGGILTIEIDEKTDGVFVIFTDTGIGMNEENRERIFQPFYTTKGFDVGRGLGMSGVYSIINEHAGKISVLNTAPGKGTSIEIVFPFLKEQEKIIEKEIKGNLSDIKSSLKVLWVEDDELIRMNAGLILKMIGHYVDTASSGKEALEYLEKNIYDIVFTDIGMPVMNGWQLADKINEKGKGKTKVTVVSGWGAEIDDAKKKQHGVEYVLGKPFTLEQLEKLLGEVVQLNSK